MQSYTELGDGVTLQNSRGPLLNNDKTIMSNSSGTAFPTVNLQIGMLCYRSDLLKLYECTDTSLQVWKLLFDLNNTATDKEYVDSVAATKQNTVTGGASTIVTSNMTASRVMISDASGKAGISAITTTKLGYLTDVTSNIQAQLNGKSSTSHDHSGVYATVSHTHSSYVNQNAFSNIAVSGQTTQSADNATDTLTLVPGANMSSIVLTEDTVTFNAAAQGVSAGSVGQSQLKTSIGTVSTSAADNTQLTLPGGQYGLYPQTYFSDSTSGDESVSMSAKIAGYYFNNDVTNQDSWITRISLNNTQQNYSGGYYSKGAQARQRYVTASPPYNLGNGDIQLFVFGLVDVATSDIECVYIAEAPPWAYNGPTDIRADFYKDGVGYKNKAVIETNWVPDGLGDFEPVMTSSNSIIEVTQEIKNADINIVPHPFANIDGKVVVMLDPFSSITRSVYEILLSEDPFVSNIVHDYIKVDNTPLGFNTPIGVMGVGVKWK